MNSRVMIVALVLSLLALICACNPFQSRDGAQKAAGYPSVYDSPEGYAAVAEAYDRVLEVWPVPYEARMVPTRFGQTHVISCGAKDAPPWCSSTEAVTVR